MEYKKYLESEHWLKLRFLKKMNTNRCAICNSKTELDIHHLNYRNLYDVELSDLRVLCRRCHFLSHDLHRQGKIKFKNTNHHSRFALIKNAVKKELKIPTTNLFKE